jgi:hypothetical protein
MWGVFIIFMDGWMEKVELYLPRRSISAQRRKVHILALW